MLLNIIKPRYSTEISRFYLDKFIFAMPIYLSLIVYYWYKNSHKRNSYIQHLLPVAGLGVLGYFVASYLDLLGLQYISAQLERVVLFCFPTIVVVMSYFFFKTTLPKNIWLLLAMSYAGILLIFGHDLSVLGSSVAKGTVLVFLSAIAFAIYVLWSKPVGVLSLFCTVIPSLLVAEAIHKIGPERTSIVGTSGPAITSIFAVIWLGEAFTVYHGIGLVLIMTAVGLMMRQKKP